MATKKFKSDVSLEQALKLPNKTANRALVIDGTGALVESTVTVTELGYMSGVTTAVQTQMDAKADLVGGKIPTAQLPALAVTKVTVVADITARDALTVGTGDGEIQEGDVVIVTDASADVAITAGSASYIYNGASYSLLKSGDEILTVNGQTGAVVLDADDISDAATVNKFATAAQLAKVDFVTVTQAVNLDTMESDITANNAKVSADGSVTSHSDVTSAGSGIIISGAERNQISLNETFNDSLGSSINGNGASKIQIEDSAEQFASINVEGALAESIDAAQAAQATADTALQPGDESTQLNYTQTTPADWTVVDGSSVGATLDEVGGRLTTLEGAPSGSAGDIDETSFAGAADTATDLDVTAFAFANATVRSFDAHVSVLIDAATDLYETFRLTGIQKAASWDMSVESTGDDSLVSFTITATGQIKYSKATTATWVSTTIKFRAITTTV